MINYIPRRFTIVRDKDLCINCGCCVRPVSYTHLDVYKRQIVGPRIGKYVKDKKTGKTVAKAIPGHSLTLGALGVFILWLDVYKRQVFNDSDFCFAYAVRLWVQVSV